MTTWEIRAAKLGLRDVPKECHVLTYRIRSLQGLNGFRGKP